MTDFGEVGYGGPAPPDKRHTYVFKLYALDLYEIEYTGSSFNNMIGLQRLADVEKAMEGHIIEQTNLQAHTRLENLIMVFLLYVILRIYHREKILLDALM